MLTQWKQVTSLNCDVLKIIVKSQVVFLFEENLLTPCTVLEHINSTSSVIGNVFQRLCERFLCKIGKLKPETPVRDISLHPVPQGFIKQEASHLILDSEIVCGYT